MKKTAFILMLITILSKILGFGREVTLSYFYGASNVSDAYLIALTIPMVIFEFIGVGISTGYIPMYSRVQELHGQLESNRYTNNLINILVVTCTGIIALGIIFAEPLVKVFAMGFAGETLVLAVRFTRLSLLGIYFTGLIYIFSGFLQINGNYVIPALIGYPLNIVIITSIILSSKIDVVVLAIGSVTATATQLLLLLPYAYGKGYRYQLVFSIRDEHIRRMAVIALPIIIGVSVNQINVLVDRTLASAIAVGGISALNYANRINEFVRGLFVAPVATVMYPMISKMAAQDNKTALKSTISEVINLVNLFVIPMTIGAIIFAEPMVTLLFCRGAFDEHAATMTSGVLVYYAFGMIGFGLRDVLSRGFYALQDTKTPMINASLSVAINIILNIILSKYMGLNGLALATSISAIICTTLLFISFRRKLGPFGMKHTVISGTKITVVSCIMVIIAKAFYEYLLTKFNGNIALLAAIMIGSTVYFIMIYFARIKEVDNMVDAVKLQFRKIVEECIMGR